jgi:hypothetical protein
MEGLECDRSTGPSVKLDRFKSWFVQILCFTRKIWEDLLNEGDRRGPHS